MTIIPLVSIIIPMYNCGAVVSRCIKSIDYPNSEIIVVDDGSTDNGAFIVEEYAKTVSNIRVIRKEHRGVSSARNIGIASATGKYIMFIDADDLLSLGGLCRIVTIAEKNNADIVKFRIESVSADSVMIKKDLNDFNIIETVFEGKAVALRRYDISDYHVVDALFKRSIIATNDIRFDEDLHLHEDDVFMAQFYCFASIVVMTNLPLYQYVRCSPYSSTHFQPIERNRILIESGLLAMKYRSRYIRKVFPKEEFPYERLKYMRWICTPKQAVEAGFTIKEYRAKLLQYNKLDGVGKMWPVSYKWIRVAGFDYSHSSYAKWVIKTFLLNHPLISYPLEKLRFL